MPTTQPSGPTSGAAISATVPVPVCNVEDRSTCTCGRLLNHIDVCVASELLCHTKLAAATICPWQMLLGAQH